MTRKQFGIIFTLLALIVCVGVLAARVNGSLPESPGDLNPTIKLTDDDESDANADYFYDQRNQQNQVDAATMESLKQIMNDSNSTAAAKEDASKEYSTLVMSQNYASKIELEIKGKGFEDALCLIQGDGTKATVVVKSKEELNQNQANEILQTVMNVSKIKDVKIESKQ